MSAISNWLWSKVTGVDIATVQAQSDAADAQLQAMNNADYAPGGKIYNQIAAEQGTQAANNAYKGVTADDNSSAAGTADAAGQVSDAFSTQLASETSAIGQAGSGLISGTLKNLFRVIPWQVWVIGGIALFVYLGGAGFVVRRVRGRLSQ